MFTLPYDTLPKSSKPINQTLRITRSIIGRTFGILKLHLHVLHSEVRMTPERVGTITIACYVLQDIAIDNYEPIPEYVEPFEHVHFVGVEIGQIVKDLANTCF